MGHFNNMLLSYNLAKGIESHFDRYYIILVSLFVLLKLRGQTINLSCYKNISSHVCDPALRPEVHTYTEKYI